MALLPRGILRTPRSVFETFTRRTAVAVTLLMTLVAAPVIAWAGYSNVIVAICASGVVWAWTLAARGHGRPERYEWDVGYASVVAVIIALAATGVILAPLHGDPVASGGDRVLGWIVAALWPWAVVSGIRHRVRVRQAPTGGVADTAPPERVEELGTCAAAASGRARPWWRLWGGPWLPTHGPGGRPLPVFTIYTWRSAITITVMMAAMVALIAFVDPWLPGRRLNPYEVPWPFAASFLVSWWTLALLGIGATDENARTRFEIACILGLLLSLATILFGMAHLRRLGLVDKDSGAASLWSIMFDVLAPLCIAFWYDRSHAAYRRQAKLEQDRLERERQARALVEARLQVLHAQIEPHFVFNALSHLEALTHDDPARANAMVRALGRYLRESMPRREGRSTLGREVDRAAAYLDIMAIRMGDRLRYRIEVPPRLRALALPAFMLPTLVENAIKHGLEARPAGGCIAIAAELDEGDLVVTVRDDGMGFTPGAQSGSGVGLANVRERLHALYGAAGTLDIAGNVPSGVIATLRVPAADQGVEDHAERADR